VPQRLVRTTSHPYTRVERHGSACTAMPMVHSVALTAGKPTWYRSRSG